MLIQDSDYVKQFSFAKKVYMPSYSTALRVKLPVRLWLLVGVVMVFFQIIIGGVTRLTDSGLSITEWALIQGTIPPLTEQQWQFAFAKYKAAAKKQYDSLHSDMTLNEFKIIFFWEYFHRLWARLMAIVFVFPFLWFLWRKWLPKWLLRHLVFVIGLAALAGIFGWIMVVSGLNNDNRTWVSAYKLVTHLAIGTFLFGYLFWIWLKAAQPLTTNLRLFHLRRFAWILTVFLFMQILFGGLMAGMRAALIHPYFPIVINGEQLWNILISADSEVIEGIIHYERYTFIKAIVQLIHRFMALILVLFVLIFYLKVKDISKQLRVGMRIIILILGIQYTLGALTIVNSIGSVPLLLGVGHQAVALILLLAFLYLNYQLDDSMRVNESSY